MAARALGEASIPKQRVLFDSTDSKSQILYYFYPGPSSEEFYPLLHARGMESRALADSCRFSGFLDQLFYFEEFTIVFFCGVYRPTAAAGETPAKADPIPSVGRTLELLLSSCCKLLCLQVLHCDPREPPA